MGSSGPHEAATPHSVYSEVIPEVHATLLWKISAHTHIVFDIQLLTEKVIIASYPF